MEVITVTGSSGTIGSELVRILSNGGASVRALFRSTRPPQPPAGVAWLQADLSDERLLAPALAGTARLFLLNDNQKGFGELQGRIVRAAESLGVAHVVKLSALGASDHSKSWIGREHHHVEQLLRQTTMSWTILRPHAFMQNWLGDVAESVRARGVVESPIGEGRVPFIDTRDIAAVAAEALLHPERHASRTYVLTGGEAVGLRDVAAAIAEATAKSVRYQPITTEEARARAEARGMPGEQIDALLAIAAYQRDGGPTAAVSGAVQQVLGRAPRTIRGFAHDYAAAFQ
jgi:uncharacterized protein YbjT (DUF2867 family)